jgi:hypothetical protein
MCDYDYTESDIMGAEARQRRRERKDDRFKLDRLRARIREPCGWVHAYLGPGWKAGG